MPVSLLVAVDLSEYTYGQNAGERGTLDTATDWLIIFENSEYMQADGWVSVWRYWASRTDNDIYLMVWRQVSISHNLYIIDK